MSLFPVWQELLIEQYVCVTILQSLKQEKFPTCCQVLLHKTNHRFTNTAAVINDVATDIAIGGFRGGKGGANTPPFGGK